jgi:site-specific recombinase XerD
MFARLNQRKITPLESWIKKVDDKDYPILGPHFERFRQYLRQKNYTALTIANSLTNLRRIDRVMRREGWTLANLVEKHGLNVTAIVAAVGGGRRDGIETFLKMLMDEGVIVLPSDPSIRGLMLDRYERFMKDERGLSDHSAQRQITNAKRFLTYRFPSSDDDFNAIVPQDIDRYLVASGDGVREAAIGLRGLLRFLFFRGYMGTNLTNYVPKVAVQKDQLVRRFLPAEEIEKIVEAARGNAFSPVDRRNYAMILILARLGLRGEELSRMLVEDIDWERGEILVRGKRGYFDRLPLTQEIGDALISYLEMRPKSEYPHLFVKTKAPYDALTADILWEVLRNLLDMLGIKIAKQTGSRLFRHSLATNMISAGATIFEVGSVLRHRSFESTMVYAKTDLPRLRKLAPQWPRRKAKK